MLIEPTEPRGLDHALKQVDKFHEKFEVPVYETPTMMDKELTLNRYKFSAEENNELLEAENIYQQVDSALDRIYFAIGDLNIMGVTNIQYLFDLVQASNMGKVWPDGKIRRDVNTGKIIKPPGWKENWDHEPRLMEEIDRQRIVNGYTFGIDFSKGTDKTIHIEHRFGCKAEEAEELTSDKEALPTLNLEKHFEHIEKKLDGE